MVSVLKHTREVHLLDMYSVKLFLYVLIASALSSPKWRSNPVATPHYCTVVNTKFLIFKTVLDQTKFLKAGDIEQSLRKTLPCNFLACLVF